MKQAPLLPEVARFIAKTQGLRIGNQQIATLHSLTTLSPSTETPLAEVAKASTPEVDLGLEAGMPPGVLNETPGLRAKARAAPAAHRGIAKVDFTGSPPHRKRRNRALQPDQKCLDRLRNGTQCNLM